MEYKYLSISKLTRCYDEWRLHIAKMQPESPDIISFKSGAPFNQEGYKYVIVERAATLIKNFDWNVPDLIGSGKLHSLAVELLAIRTTSNDVQNLVDYRDIMEFTLLDNRSKLKDIETALYLLYAKDQDMEAFMLFSHVLKKKYALISYFFFLKKSSKYQVVRPDNAAKRFALIDSPVKCTQTCTWENYLLFNSVLTEVQSFLSDQMNENISLTDAHSFVWMFWMLKGFK